jgi:hypothetical protein
MLREATYPPAAVNVLDVSSESMAAFQVFLYGRFWVFTEDTNAAGFQLDVHGTNSAIQQITDVMSEPHRFAFKLAPAEMKLVSDQQPVGLAQAITATKVLIRTEANFTPKSVGLPAKVIVMEPPTVPATTNKQKHSGKKNGKKN